MNIKEMMRRSGPLAGLLMMSTVLSILSPYFLTADNALNILRQSAVNALLALGQLLVIITAGIDLSVGSIVGLACVVTAMLLKAGLGAPLSFLAGVLLGVGMGVINGLLLTRLRLPHPFISTLGMMNVARGAALIVSGGFPISDLGPGIRWVGAGAWMGVPIAVWLVLLCCLGTHLFLAHSTVGRDLYAIGGNKQAAMFSGIPVDRRLVLVYATSGGFAAIAALVLAGRMNSGFPLAGVGAELDAIAAAIIGGASFFGGVGTVWGTMMGALIMGVLRNGLNLLNVSSSWQTVVIGLVIVWAVWIDVLRRRRLQKPRPA